MKATILVTVIGNKVATLINCETYELETILGPVADEIKTVVEEALIPTDSLVVDVKS